MVRFEVRVAVIVKTAAFFDTMSCILAHRH